MSDAFEKVARNPQAESEDGITSILDQAKSILPHGVHISPLFSHFSSTITSHAFRLLLVPEQVSRLTTIGHQALTPAYLNQACGSLLRRLGRLRSSSGGSFDLFALDPVDDLQTLGLLDDPVELLLAREPNLHLLNEVLKADELAFLQRVVLGETHLFELGLALGKFILVDGPLI